MSHFNNNLNEGNEILDNQLINSASLTNLTQIEAQETQNDVDALGISGENNLHTLASI